MRGRRRTLRAALILLLAVPSVYAASRPPAEQSKIDWLLTQIDQSGAIFIRNAKEYDAKKAVSHLKTKLFFAGRRVQTASEFIKGVASHSQETGKLYEIRFADGKQRPLSDWLNERLTALETGKATKETATKTTK